MYTDKMIDLYPFDRNTARFKSEHGVTSWLMFLTLEKERILGLNPERRVEIRYFKPDYSQYEQSALYVNEFRYSEDCKCEDCVRRTCSVVDRKLQQILKGEKE